MAYYHTQPLPLPHSSHLLFAPVSIPPPPFSSPIFTRWAVEALVSGVKDPVPNCRFNACKAIQHAGVGVYVCVCISSPLRLSFSLPPFFLALSAAPLRLSLPSPECVCTGQGHTWIRPH